MSLLFAAVTLCILPGAADAKKKRDKIGLASYNLYLGSDLGPASTAGAQSRTDLFADEVGFVLKDVDANNFSTRAIQIAKDIQKRKVDLVGLQEAALWKVQVPTDVTPIGPGNIRAGLVSYDYIQTLLDELNAKAKTAKQCKSQRKKAADTPGGKDDRKAANCYRGYELVVSQQEADLEFFGDFDNSSGPDGQTCDLSSGTCPPPVTPSNSWASGNDDTGISFGEPGPVRQCSDGINNDPGGGAGQDALIDWPADPECADNTDGVEVLAGHQDTPAFPQDANFDSGAAAETPNNVSGEGAGTDPTPIGTGDCPDLKAGASGGVNPVGPFAGSVWVNDSTPVCLFHGIDGDASLTMRDAILARKGFGVKTKSSTSGNFSSPSTFKVTVFGGQATIPFTRGWVATDAKVRGKSFRFVNTHLESESAATFREDQASELIAPGGPATAPTTVLVGDLNSDPTREPINVPNGDGGSKIAIDRLFAAGFSHVTQTGLSTGGHGELLSDQSDLLGDGWIDHILTNNPSNIVRSGSAQVIDTFANGLWNSDHGGVFVKIKGKKKK